MRVYELSKELNIPSKALLDLLKQKGHSVKNHMSLLSPEVVALIKNQFTKSEPEAPKSIMQKESVSKTSSKSHLVNTKKENYEKPQQSIISSRKPIQNNIVQSESKHPEQIVIKPMSVADTAATVGVATNDLILLLLQWGVVSTINQVLREDTITRIAQHYGIKPIKPEVQVSESRERLAAQGTGKLSSRLPVVVVLGHVDHGKTTLLDYIRKTRVVAKEKGGITQHLGAYEAKTKQGNIVFLDTPGHEAFPKMRQRGIKVADLAILVIAADDGIMPQTIEVIKNIKNMHIPIIVAINKVDKVEPARLEVVKRQLASHDLLPEEWGGDVVCMPISALKGIGIDALVEMVALQTQLLELKATFEGPAKGYVLESKLEKGRGPVATLICQHGTLRIGDYFVCGNTSGRVSSMTDSYGTSLIAAEPSKPVQVAGFSELPEVGDLFSVVDKADIRKIQTAASDRKASLVERSTGEGSFNIILKTDTNSSKEALRDSIEKLSKKMNVIFTVIHAGVGNINEGDVELAYNTGASIIGLHVKAESNARSVAKHRGVSILLHDIIYKLLEELEQNSQKEKEIEMVRTKVGEAIVRKVFNIKGVGVIAGSYIQDGRFVKNGYVVAWRGRQKLGEGKITSLQRDKKTVKEVHTGYECGFVVEGIEDWYEGDRAECYVDMPKQ
jgi:translation initiation factor IF-2